MDTNKTVKLWAVHSLGDAFSAEQGNISFDWPAMGDLNALRPDREDFRRKFDAVYPDANAANRAAVAGALYRLVYEMESGDYVACLHSDTVSLGTIGGPYAFRDGTHQRPVNWARHIPQSEFSRDAMREITCSPVRLFAVKRFAGEFLSPLGVAWLEPERPARPAAVPSRTEAVPAPRSRETVTGTDAAQFVLETLRRSLTRESFRQFAAALLRAMGYTISLPPDGGLNEYEMTASRDELFPPVLVQVRAGDVRDSDVTRLQEALGPDRYGLVITLSEFSGRVGQSLRDAPRLRAVDGPELAALTLKYYSGLDERYRALIPLRMVYVPVQ